MGKTIGTAGCGKTDLPADANKPTPFYLMQTKAGTLGEDGLPGEEESFKKGETAESCIKVRAVTPAASTVTMTGLTADFIAALVCWV